MLLHGRVGIESEVRIDLDIDIFFEIGDNGLQQVAVVSIQNQLGESSPAYRHRGQDDSSTDIDSTKCVVVVPMPFQHQIAPFCGRLLVGHNSESPLLQELTKLVVPLGHENGRGGDDERSARYFPVPTNGTRHLSILLNEYARR